MRRTKLAGDTANSPVVRALCNLIHLTDLHAVDVQSPGRYEFMERLWGSEDDLTIVLPAYRPQEALTLHAIDAMVRTINRLGPLPVSGTPAQLLLSTGDTIDNQQTNELTWSLRLMDGGAVDPSSGRGRYEGVQAAGWSDPYYWHPDGTPDRFKDALGFPTVPGLLDRAMLPFDAEGCRLPWLACYGNHDALILGAARTNHAMEAVLRGDRKAETAPTGFRQHHLSGFVAHPEHLLTGRARQVTPDPERRTCDREAFVAAHLAAPGGPPGHGLGAHRRGEPLQYVHDVSPWIRLIVLDTTNPAGGYAGSISDDSLGWLEERLIEVHSRYRSAEGTWVRTVNDDRLVVLASHHPAAGLFNLRAAAGESRRVLQVELEALLHRFGNVILWLNGHTHHNHIRPCPSPHGSGGFWEVTTASLVDWPCEARAVELVEHADGTLSIQCTMVPYDAPPGSLAALFRELAANDPHAGIHSARAGTPADRTVQLPIPAPFPLY